VGQEIFMVLTEEQKVEFTHTKAIQAFACFVSIRILLSKHVIWLSLTLMGGEYGLIY
jgi:hypothetical protein